MNGDPRTELLQQPSPRDQVQFLVNVQRLLDEGLFVASYKFALLLSLADLCVEKGDDSGFPLLLSSDEIAGKVIQYYWRQSAPYPSSNQATILQQNTGKQAAILNTIAEARKKVGDSLAKIDKSSSAWRKLVKRVAGVIKVMPLWKLQTIGNQCFDFLYENTKRGRTIELRPGVAYCLRKFYPLISDLVRGAWVRYVRLQNLAVLGETSDLHQFLFGSERIALAIVRGVMLDIQNGRCFYCRRPLEMASTQVDHFISWARYPVDLGHNFVLADSRCNNNKGDRLAAYEHLITWAERNATFGGQIAEALKQRGIISELNASMRIGRWAYEQAEAANGLTWLHSDHLVPLSAEWRKLF